MLKSKEKKELIYLIKNSKIEHTGGISQNFNFEKLRNWHWMWSKFYFNKKHNGYIVATTKIGLNFFSSLFKLIYFF